MENKINGKGLQLNIPKRRRIFRILDQQKYTNSYTMFMSCTVNYRKWWIKRRDAHFIFPVMGAALNIQERRLLQLRVKHWGEYRENKVKICIRDYNNLCRSFSVFTWNLSTVFILSTCDLFDLTVSHKRLKKWSFLTKSLVESQVIRFYYECIYMNDFSVLF